MNREQAKQINADIRTALAAVLTKHDLSLAGVRTTFNAVELTVKLKLEVGDGKAAARLRWQSLAMRLCNDSDHYDTIVRLFDQPITYLHREIKFVDATRGTRYVAIADIYGVPHKMTAAAVLACAAEVK